MKCVKDWELQGDGKYIGTIRPGASAEVPRILSVRATEYHPGPSAVNRPEYEPTPKVLTTSPDPQLSPVPYWDLDQCRVPTLRTLFQK